MSMALMGPIELLMIAVLGGVPVVMPPLPADDGMLSVVPAECMVYASWYGVDRPNAGSGNSTEALMAEPQVKQFLGMVMTSIERAINSENAPPDFRQGAEIFLPLVKDLYSRPVTFYVGDMAPTAFGFDMDAAFVVHCGDRKESLQQAAQSLEALIAAGTGMQFNEMDRSGTKFRKMMMPPEAPEMGWGISGDYLIFAVGSSTFDDVIRRLTAKRGPPPWLRQVHEKLAVDRPGFVQYINVTKIGEVIRNTMPLEVDQVNQVLNAWGITTIQSVATVQGYDATSVVSKTHIATAGTPSGILGLLAGEPLSKSDLAGIPADANLAFAMRWDAEQKLNDLIGLAVAMDPNAAEFIEEGVQELGQEFGIDLREDLLAPLGDVVRVYNSAEEGGLIFTGLTMVVDVEDPDRMAATYRKITGMLESEFSAYGGSTGLRISETDGGTICYLSLGRETPLAPAWCLRDDKLIIGLYPQSVKSFLTRADSAGSLADVPEVDALFSSGRTPYMVSYQDTHDLVRTLYPLAQMFMPVLANELQREGFDFDLAVFPSANAVLPHMTPGISMCSADSDGLYFESHQAMPGLSAAPVLLVMGLGVWTTESRMVEFGPRHPEASNNLQELAIAFHNFHDANGRLPAAVNADEQGNPLLSWRVHVLPFLEGGAELYEQFHLNEPWDSEHNKTLIAQMPDVFKSPGGKELEEGMTSMLVPTGDDTIFPIGGRGPGRGLSLASIADGTSNTLMIIEASPEAAVPWTKPQDWAFDANAPSENLVGHRRGGFLAVFADAHASFINEAVDAETIKAVFTRAGGEVVDTFELEDASGPIDATDRAIPVPPRAIRARQMMRAVPIRR